METAVNQRRSFGEPAGVAVARRVPLQHLDEDLRRTERLPDVVVQFARDVLPLRFLQIDKPCRERLETLEILTEGRGDHVLEQESQTNEENHVQQQKARRELS